jgi:uncharacterized protein (TIGR03435 family)
MRIITVVAMLLVSSLSMTGQRVFDVSSVKENRDPAGSPAGMLRFLPDGGVTAVRARPRGLILVAYQLPDYQLLRAPAWISETFFDIVAKPAAPVTRPESYEMLQGLLRDRFQLQVHREAQEVNGFALVRATPDQLGPSLQSSTLDCARVFASTPRCRESRLTNTSMTAVGIGLDSLVNLITARLEAPIRDETGLLGTFDFSMKWSDDPSANDDLPGLTTALQEQLGLKLQRRRLSVQMLVIDKIERPSAD